MSRRNYIRHLSGTNFLWVVGLLLCVLGVVFSTMLLTPGSEVLYSDEVVSPFWELIRGFIPGEWLPVLIQFLLLVANAILFQFIVRRYELLRTLGVLTFFIYCFITAASIPLHRLIPGSFAALFIGLAYFSVFESYRKENCNNQVFNASFLIVLAALFVPPLIFLLPLFWLAFNIVNTMNFKRWLVSLMGALTVFWLLGGVLFLSDRLELIPAFFKACIQYGWVFSAELPTMGIVFSLCFFCWLCWLLSTTCGRCIPKKSVCVRLFPFC
jgi:magnesium-transporting ATPase (P-type)